MKYFLSALPEIDVSLRNAQRILIATDFDGTLCPIACSPDEVHVAPAMLEILRYITTSERITFAVISGRALTDVSARLPLDITFAGNHGLEISGRGLSFEHPEGVALRPELASACDALTRMVADWPGAWVEDKGLTATVHYRKVDARRQHSLLFAVRTCLKPFGMHFALRAGNKALELRPKGSCDKGFAMNYIREHKGPFDACICIGDDRTDETMFRANSDQLNIKVGAGGPTDATYYVSDSNEVAIFLSHVLDLVNFGVVAAATVYETPVTSSPVTV